MASLKKVRDQIDRLDDSLLKLLNERGRLVENSTEGVVNHTLDMFVDSNLSICAEMELPIWHYLLGRDSEYRKKGKVRALYSHYQALAQCRQWVEAHLPGIRVVESSSTAE